jgi:SAM-dependent methyltransferase
MQITTGIRSILSKPFFYSLFQYIMGAHSFWNDFVLHTLKLKGDELILDIGCGPADILTYIPISTKYWGFDISKAYINKAYKKYQNRGHFFCKFLYESDLKLLPKFDYVILMGVLHHIDDDEAKRVLKLAKLALKSKGFLVTVDPCFSEGQSIIARFLISKDRGQNVRNETEYKKLTASVFPNVKVNIKHKSWIPYTHCIMKCSK